MSDEKDFGLDGQWGEAYPAEPAAPSAEEDPDQDVIDLDFSSGTDGKEEAGPDSGQPDFYEEEADGMPAGEEEADRPYPEDGVPEEEGSASASADSAEAASGPDGETAESAGAGKEAGPVHGFTAKSGADRNGDFDWEEDEPKYDTQTGERLDRPKAKWPGIVLTAVVTVATLGSLIYASIPGTIKESHTVQSADDADTETEAAVLSIADGSVTEETEGIAPVPEQPAAAVPESETEEDITVSAVPAPEAAGVQQASSLTDIVQVVAPCLVSVTAASPETVSAYCKGGGSLEGVPFCSGFIVQEDDENLYILTDGQIAADDGDLTVGFNTGEQDAAGGLAQAVLSGTDEQTSLALLRVEKNKIAPEILERTEMAEINTEGQAAVGENVALVGKTVSYGQSVMQGIVCAVSARTDPAGGQSGYILTDIPVNALNNGGPLVNMGGEVIGIAAAAEKSADGMSSILPFGEAVLALDRINGANQAEALLSAVMPLKNSEQTEEEAGKALQQESEKPEVLPEEAEKTAEEETAAAGSAEEAGTEAPESEEAAGSEPETADRTGNAAQGGQLGIHVAEISDERQIIDRLPAGVYIADVISQSGAWEAGLAAGDVIVGLNGRQTLTLEELREVLGQTKAGDKVQVSYLRADSRGKYNEKRVRRLLVTLS